MALSTTLVVPTKNLKFQDGRESWGRVRKEFGISCPEY